MKIKELKNVIETELRKTDYSGRAVVELSNTPYSAQIKLENHQMEFGFNLKYKELPFWRKIVARDLPRHEYGHIGGKLTEGGKVLGVPGNVETSETHFFNPIYEVLSKKGFSAKDADYVENTLEDTLLHLEGSKRQEWHGITRFFKLQDFSDYYEAHVKLNMLLWGSPSQKNRIRENYKGSKKASKAVMKFLERINHKWDFDKGKLSKETREYLLNPKNWKQISKAYAEEFSTLISSNYARPTLNHNGAGTKGREKEDDSAQGNVFQRQRKTDSYRKGRAREAYEKGEKFPGWMSEKKEDVGESLELLYDSLADSLEVRAESETIQDSLPIATIVSKEFDPLTDTDSETFVSINEEGKPALYIPRKKLELPHQLKIGSRGFPRIKYVQLDSSGSMKQGVDSKGKGRTVPIHWGDNSKYHYSILAWKSFVKYLILNGLLVDKDSIELDNFSTKTITGKGLDAANRAAFMPQWDSTYLDKQRVKDIFKGDKNLIFTISDGEIWNWRGDERKKGVKKDFLEGAKRNHYFHFQIGNHSDASRDMKKAGLHVEQCRGHKDLVGRVIDLTREIRQ